MTTSTKRSAQFSLRFLLLLTIVLTPAGAWLWPPFNEWPSSSPEPVYSIDLDFPFDEDLFGVHFPVDCPDAYEFLELQKARQRGPDAYDRAKRKLINKYKDSYRRNIPAQ